MGIRGVLFFITLRISLGLFAQQPPNTVMLTSGELYYISKIEVVKLKYARNHLVLNNTDTIFFEDINFYQKGQDFFLVREMGDYGYVDLHRTVFGRISIFEFTENLYDPGFGGGIDKKTQTYYLKGSELKPISVNNLIRDMQDSPTSIAKLKSSRNRRLIRTAFFIGGLGVASYGTSKMLKPDHHSNPNSKSFQFEFNPEFVAGLATMILALTVNKSYDYSVEEIILDYNNEFREKLTTTH